MNAVADDIADDLPRKIHGAERSWLEYSLHAWGDWIWERRHYEGHRSCDNVTAYLNGAGGGEPGHRVLCLDMPHRIYSMHARVILLPEGERLAIEAEYIPTVKDDGTLWTRQEKCARLGLSERGYRDRLFRGKLRILGLSVDGAKSCPW